MSTDLNDLIYCLHSGLVGFCRNFISSNDYLLQMRKRAMERTEAMLRKDKKPPE